MSQAPEITTTKAKPYISYEKIAIFKYKMARTEKGMRPQSSSTFTAFERENGVSFNCRSANHMTTDDTSKFVTTFAYAFKMYKNRKGETRFKFYRTPARNHGRPRASSPEHMRTNLASMLMNSQRKYRRPVIPPEQVRLGLCKVQMKRLYKFVKAFLDKHGVNYKYLSKDPFVLMSQLCYPGLAVLDDTTARNCVPGEFFLKDPLKLTLRTKGKKSRKLLHEVLEEAPNSCQSVMRMLKYLRINRSLDEAQKFMELLLAPHNYQLVPNCRTTRVGRYDHAEGILGSTYSIKNFTAKQMKIFDPVSLESIVTVMTGQRQILRDTLMMIDANKENDPNFDYTQIQYRTILQLHDALIGMRPRPARRGLRGYNPVLTFHERIQSPSFINTEFDEDSVHIQFCRALESGFSHEQFVITYAKNSAELSEQSQAMHNCSFGYRGDIASNNFSIFCVSDAETKKPVYMFGFNAYARSTDDTGNGVAIMQYAEAKAVCNKMIPREIMGDLLERIYAAFGVELADAHKNLSPWSRGTGPVIQIPIRSGYMPRSKNPSGYFNGNIEGVQFVPYPGYDQVMAPVEHDMPF
jgi:hypothetical protein